MSDCVGIVVGIEMRSDLADRQLVKLREEGAQIVCRGERILTGDVQLCSIAR